MGIYNFKGKGEPTHYDLHFMGISENGLGYISEILI